MYGLMDNLNCLIMDLRRARSSFVSSFLIEFLFAEFNLLLFLDYYTSLPVSGITAPVRASLADIELMLLGIPGMSISSV